MSGEFASRGGLGSTPVSDEVGVARHGYRALLERAALALGSGETAPGLELLRMAVDVAWRQPVGIMVDLELEYLLRQAGAQVASSSPLDWARDGGGEPGRNAAPVVVHIVTPGVDTDVRGLVEDWIGVENSLGLVSGIVLTRPGDSPIAESVRLSRELAGADVVILHSEPWDVSPLVALAAVSPRPARVLVDHHPDALTLGVGLADLLVEPDSAGVGVAVSRRFVPPGRCLVLPPPPARPGWVEEVHQRLEDIPAPLLPNANLMGPVPVEDRIRAEALRREGRIGGPLSAYLRLGGDLEAPWVPDLSIVILAEHREMTLDLMEELLWGWSGPGWPHLVVVDNSREAALSELAAEAGQSVCLIRPTVPVDRVEAVALALSSCWGPWILVLADTAMAGPNWPDDLLGAMSAGGDSPPATTVGFEAGSRGLLLRTDRLDGGEWVEALHGEKYEKHPV